MTKLQILGEKPVVYAAEVRYDSGVRRNRVNGPTNASSHLAVGGGQAVTFTHSTALIRKASV